MFCKNCGHELNEKGEYCPHCGSGLECVSENKKHTFLRGKALLAVVAILAVVIASICSVNRINSSPEKVAVAAIKSEYEIDINTMIKCFPDFTIREIAEEEGLSVNASKNDVIQAVKNFYRYETPQKVKIIHTEVAGKYDISDYDILREIYDSMTNKEYKQITTVARVNVEFSVDGDDQSIQVTCIKMKNKWYFLRRQY